MLKPQALLNAVETELHKVLPREEGEVVEVVEACQGEEEIPAEAASIPPYPKRLLPRQLAMTRSHQFHQAPK
jgi:hypothetical protein